MPAAKLLAGEIDDLALANRAARQAEIFGLTTNHSSRRFDLAGYFLGTDAFQPKPLKRVVALGRPTSVPRGQSAFLRTAKNGPLGSLE